VAMEHGTERDLGRVILVQWTVCVGVYEVRPTPHVALHEAVMHA
jgi:hypothetical protein